MSVVTFTHASYPPGKERTVTIRLDIVARFEEVGKWIYVYCGCTDLKGNILPYVFTPDDTGYNVVRKYLDDLKKSG